MPSSSFSRAAASSNRISAEVQGLVSWSSGGALTGMNRQLYRYQTRLHWWKQMPEELNGGSPARFDRIERIVEVLANTQLDLQQDVKILIRGQVVIGEALERLTSTTNQRINELAEAQKHTEERLNALIAVVDGIARRLPPTA